MLRDAGNTEGKNGLIALLQRFVWTLMHVQLSLAHVQLSTYIAFFYNIFKGKNKKTSLSNFLNFKLFFYILT